MCAFTMTSCATWQRTFFKEDLSKISPGEDKQTVVSKLGGTANPIAFETKNGHTYEVLEFVEKPVYVGRVNDAFWTRYWVYFEDGKYVKYALATEANAMAQNKDYQQQMAGAAALSAVKGTSVMPYTVNQQHSGTVQHTGTINQNINADVRVR